MASCSSEFTTPPPVIPSDALEELIISEISTYINTDATAGGVRNHYVEIYNGSVKDIDLSNYAIGYQATTDTSTLVDWSFSSASNYLQLTGILGTLKAYVIASPVANITAVKRDITWGTSSTATADASKPLQLSGNSGIALLKKDASGTYTLNGVQYKIIDVFGSPNVARVLFVGTQSSRNNLFWPIAGIITDTRNRTFWRKSTIIKPNTDWNLSKGTSAADSEWNVSEDRLWDYSNVGIFTK